MKGVGSLRRQGELDILCLKTKGDSMKDNTIAALATPAGKGGLAVIRISGPQAVDILQKLFVPARQDQAFSDRYLMYGHAKHRGATLDECMAVVMKAPRTYTREDVAELFLHGGEQVASQVLGALYALGASPAQPGEFTYRAFLNGRLDLSQAEAVMQLISATGKRAGEAALRQLQGGALRFVSDMQAELISIMAGVTAAIDFPDEIDPKEALDDILPRMEGLVDKLNAACDERGARMLAEGMRVAICGQPNVGKSSLFNALLMEDRAIVTDLPGTTRDLIHGAIELDGIRVLLTDTAGIRDSGERVERIGVERALQTMRDADLRLLVLDVDREPDDADHDLFMQTAQLPRLVVLNKTDLKQASGLDEWLQQHLLPGESPLRVSAGLGEGLSALKQAVRQHAGQPDQGALSLSRHMQLAREAATDIQSASQAMREGISLDVCAVELNSALIALGKITGDNVSESLLDEVFASFCVGK